MSLFDSYIERGPDPENYVFLGAYHEPRYEAIHGGNSVDSSGTGAPELSKTRTYEHDSMELRKNNILGFICYGKASLADRVYDLYWIATDPCYQKMGVASLLLKCLDERLKLLGARMILAETSSRADYANAQRTYLKNGYQLVATIKDFYANKNDMLVFSKRYDA